MNLVSREYQLEIAELICSSWDHAAGYPEAQDTGISL